MGNTAIVKNLRTTVMHEALRQNLVDRQEYFDIVMFT